MPLNYHKYGKDDENLMMSRALVDVAMEGKLDLEEFIAASYLIDERKAGKSIPISLPSDLLQKLQPIIKYKNIFKKLDPSNTGFATGDKVRELFLTFGISIPELRTIWYERVRFGILKTKG